MSANDLLLYARKNFLLMIFSALSAAAGAYSNFYDSPNYEAPTRFVVTNGQGSPLQSLTGNWSSSGELNNNTISKFNSYFRSNTLRADLYEELQKKNQLHLLTHLLPRKGNFIHGLLYKFGLADEPLRSTQNLDEIPQNPEELIGLVQNNLKVIVQENVFSVTVPSFSPEASVELANLVMDLGIREVTALELKEFSHSIEFLESQITGVQERLKNIDTQLTEVKALKEGESSEVQESNRQLAALRQQLLTSDANVLKLQNLIQNLKRNKPLDYANRNRLFKMQQELTYWKSDAGSVKKLIKSIKNSDSKVMKNLQLAGGIQNLERQQAFEYNNLSSLEKSLLQLKMQSLLTKNNVRVIEKGSMNGVFVTQLPVVGMLSSMVLAAFAVLFLIYLKDFLSPTMKSREDIDHLNFLNIGSVPDLSYGKSFLKTNSTLKGTEDNFLTIPQDSPESFVFGSIRTKMLHIMESSKKMQLISVTSPGQGEGKSLLTGKIATSFANAGKKVLLVDGDVIKKDVSKGIGAENKAGFRDILLSQAKFKEVVINSELWENLDILPAGQGQGSVADSLLSQALVDMLRECRKIYDIILFDNLAFLIAPDSLLLCRFSDLTLVVGCAGTTPVNDLTTMAVELKENGVNTVGCVINKYGSLLKYVYLHTQENSELKKASGS